MAITEMFATTAQAVCALELVDAASITSLEEDALLAAHALITEHRRHADTLAARFAAELHRRSSRNAGHSGLAQRKGFGSTETMLQTLSPVGGLPQSPILRPLASFSRSASDCSLACRSSQSTS